MSRSLADPLFERLFRAFPADQAYTWTDWESDPMPEPVRHFLAQMLRHQSRHEARRLRRACTDWVDYDHPAMERAFDRLTLEMEDHGQVPRKEWPNTLRKATQHVSSYLVRPVHVLVEFVFGEQTRPLDLSTIRWRMRFFGPYAYLREAVDAYAEQRDLSSFQRETFEHFLRRIDARLTSDYGPDRWLRLLDPLFRIARVATDSDSVPVRLLAHFFEEKEADDVAAALRSYRQRGHDHIGRSALRRLVREALQADADASSRPAPRPSTDSSAPGSSAPDSSAPEPRSVPQTDSEPNETTPPADRNAGSTRNKPVHRESDYGESVQDESRRDRPANNEPANNEPAGNEPAGNEPVQDEPVQDEPVQDEPVQDEPVENEPVQDEPVREAQSESANAQPEPAAESPPEAETTAEAEAEENPWKSDDPWSRIRAQMEADPSSSSAPASQEAASEAPPDRRDDRDGATAPPSTPEPAAPSAESAPKSSPPPASEPVESAAESGGSESEDGDASDTIWGVHGSARPAGGEAPDSGARRGSPAESNESTPLWKRFQGGRDSRAESAGGTSERSRTPSSSEPASPSGGDQPLWARFQQGRKAQGGANAPASNGPRDASDAGDSGDASPGAAPSERERPAPDAGASDLAALEHTVLGESNPPHRSVYVRQLFGNSMDAYRNVLQTLATIDTWGQASQVIARDVFRRHKVNIYSDAAVHFTNAVETRYRESRS